MASRRSSRRREQDSSIISIPELPLGGDFEGDDTFPNVSIFDLYTDSEAPSTSSLSQSSLDSKKSKTSGPTKNPKKGQRFAKLSGVAEEDDEEICESAASFVSNRSVLSSIESNSVKQLTKKKRVQKKKESTTVAEIDVEGESASTDLGTRDHKSKGKLNKEKSIGKGKNQKAKKDAKKDSVEPEAATASPGVASRLRRSQIPKSQAESEKENTAPARNKGSSKKPVGTQVNARMLPRASKKRPKKPSSDAGDPASSSSNQKGENLKAERKSRSKKPRPGENSSSSVFPVSSSPLELISPIKRTETESTGHHLDNQNNTDNTMDGIPSISSDHQQPKPRKPRGNRKARRSLSDEIERNTSSNPGQNPQPSNGHAESANSEPVSSSSGGTSSVQPSSEDLVINCNTGVSIKLNSKILKSGGAITIEPREDSKGDTSTLNKTKSKAKLSFGTLAKRGGKNRRLSTWSSGSDSDDSSDGCCDCSGSSSSESDTSGSSTGSDSESGSSTSSYGTCSIPHSKTICRKCGECDYCCVCRS